MKLKNKIIISSAVFVSIIVLIFTGFFITYQYEKISYKKTELANVHSEVIITRSSDGVPLIAVSSKEDIFFSLGYIHAQDRLNIMEYQRALATGTLNHFVNNPDSELLDRLASIIGFTREADILYSKLDDDIKEQITKYTEGVNQIRHTRHFAKTGKNDWTPLDVLAVLIMKEWTDAYLTNTELLFPFNESKKAEIYKTFQSHEMFYYYNDRETPYLYIINRIKNLLEQYTGSFNTGYSVHVASLLNSRDERNFTAFSYTENYNSYPGWYPVIIRSGEQSISAITYNGLPFIFSFKNDKHFFSHFNIKADSQDFLLFNTRKNNNSYQYNHRGIWKEFQPVRIPDGNDRTLHTLRWITDKGPILSDLISSDKQNDQILCINSVLPGPGYLKILITAPFETDNLKLKNLILKSDTSLKGFLLKTETDSYKFFSGYITSPDPSKKIISDGSKIYKPEFLKISTIKTITDRDYIGSDLTTSKDIPAVRPGILTTNQLKLNTLLSLLPDKKIYNEEYINELTRDTHSGAADLFIPIFNQILSSAPLTSAKMSKIYFTEWDFTSKYKLQAPSIFYTTLTFMFNETFKDDFGNDTDNLIENSHLLYEDFYQIFSKNIISIFDNAGTLQIETRETIFDKAFLNSMRYLNRKCGPLMEEWKWEKLNRNYYKIPNITSTFYSRLFMPDEIASNGAPDSLFCSLFTPEFKPVSATALTGLMTEDRFSFRMDYTYSSSIFSDFFYGKHYRVKYSDAPENDVSYTTVIKPF